MECRRAFAIPILLGQLTLVGETLRLYNGKFGLSLFLLNRDLKQEMEVSVDARSFGRLMVSERLELRHDDLNATNGKDAPDKVKPGPLQSVTFEGGRLQATLKPASWNVIHLAAD